VWRSVPKADAMPRPAKAGAADFTKRETRVDRASAARRKPIVRGPRRTTLCRAGFAGRGMAFASSTNAARSRPIPTRDAVSGRRQRWQIRRT